MSNAVHYKVLDGACKMQCSLVEYSLGSCETYQSMSSKDLGPQLLGIRSQSKLYTVLHHCTALDFTKLYNAQDHTKCFDETYLIN